jgi:hypothetical protein
MGNEQQERIATVHSPLDVPQSLFCRSFWLWVDSVGGFLVCPGDRVVIGQPTTDGPVDVPLLGDVSRRHAVLHREREHYVLASERGEVRVDGKPVERSAVLTSGSVIELGRTARLRLVLPHPLSMTARLEFVSAHRTQPRADAVLLMAETCVLGPKATSHVCCPSWSSEVVLFRESDSVVAAAGDAISIDGGVATRRGTLGPASRVTGSNFSFSVDRTSIDRT